MRVNSNATAVETPEKMEPPNMMYNTTSVRVSESFETRSSPSTELVRMLLAVDRIHRFNHTPALESLENMKLTIKTRNIIRKLFEDFYDDLSDWILVLERTSIEAEKFSSFHRDYVHFEFRVQKEYSFAVIVLLNYMKNFSLTPDTAFVEVFRLSLMETFCKECCVDDGIEKIDAKQEIRRRNLNYLRRVIVKEVIDEGIEDSDDDPDFDLKHGEPKDDTSSESTTEYDSKIFHSRKKTLLEENNKENVDEQILSNPFVDSDENLNDAYEFREESGINPFESSEDELEIPKSKNSKERGQLAQKISSSSVKSLPNIKCDHCQKMFSNKYNMKLHLIQIHRIFVEKMEVFQCPELQCSFVTGSKILYNRHATTHLRNSSKIKVLICLIPIKKKLT